MNNSMTGKAQKFKTILVLAVIAVLSLGVILFRGSDIILNVDGTEIEIVSYAKTVQELIEEEDIIKENAYIDLALDREIEDGLEITVKNPKNYTIDVNGLLTPVTSVHKEVEKILEDAGINIGEYDYTFPELSDSVAPGANIEYFHVDIVEDVEEEVLPFEKEVKENAKLEKDKVRNIQEGKEGLKKIEIEREYVNGALVKSTVTNEEVVTEPVTHIDEIGTKKPEPLPVKASRPAAKQGSQASRGAARGVVTMNASAYDLSFASTGKNPGDRGYGITASGTQVRPGVVSVDPRVIPLGTRLYIESLDGSADYGHAVAEDTGGAIKGNKIDLFFSSRSGALNFGRRNVKVHILD